MYYLNGPKVLYFKRPVQVKRMKNVESINRHIPKTVIPPIQDNKTKYLFNLVKIMLKR